MLGFVFCDLDDAEPAADAVTSFYSHEVVRGAERAARRVGDAVLLAATHSASDRKRVLALATKVDGLAVMAGSLSPADLRRLAARVPVVSFAAGRPPAELDSVSVDNFEGMRAATSHLLGHGYGNIAFVAGPSRSAEGRARFNGYRRALAGRRPRRPDCSRRCGATSPSRAASRAVEQLAARTGEPAARARRRQRPDGGRGDRARSNARGFRVPEDVAVTGFDDIPLARHVHPTLTTVRQPLRQIGEECTRLLLRRIDRSDAERASVVLPTTLVVRESCGCAGAADG